MASNPKGEGSKKGGTRLPNHPAEAPAILRWSLRALVAVAGPVLLLGLLEAGLRLADYGHQSSFWIPLDGEDAVVTNQHFGRRFFPAPLARTPEPVRLRTPKPPGTYRIFVVGGSAAMGVPEPAFSFGRILEALLQNQHPDAKFEVVNAAMTAINSHVVLPIVRDCAASEPDLFVVYMGNNEVVGPYGPGTVFQRSLPSLTLLRFSIWLNSTRAGQWAGKIAMQLGSGAARPRDWKGMAMFLDHQIPAGHPALEQTYRNFRQNLVDLCDAARRSGAPTILSTVATNLKDSPPFASLHRQGLSESDRSRWDGLYQAGEKAEASGNFQEALAQYEQAGALDDRYAERHFRIARCHRMLGRENLAKQHYVLARDLDALRFRADTRLNEVIREVAREMDSQEVKLVDVERLLEQCELVQDGIPGDELFFEHVHPNFDGNYELAKTLLEPVAGLLPPGRSRQEPRATPLTRHEIAQQLVLTEWDRYRMKARITDMMSRPPFTNQFDHESQRKRRDEELRTLKSKYTKQEGLQQVRKMYESATRRVPNEIYLSRRYAELLAAAGDFDAAAAEWRRLLEQIPDNKSWRSALAATLNDAGKLEAALEQYRLALRIDPEFATAHFGIGSVLQKQGKWEESSRSYRETLRLNSGYAEAENNLGVMAMTHGESQQALAHYSEALRIRPDYAEAWNNKGLALLELGRVEEAIPPFSRAAELDPDFAAAYYHWGGALARLGRFDKAIPRYQEALRIRPDYALAHYSLGAALAGTGASDAAIQHYSEAVRLNPDLAEAHYDLGLLLSRQGKVDEAIERYAAALRIKPDYAGALNNMGTALARLRRFDEAIEYFSKALAVQPDFAEARKNLQKARSLSEKARTGAPSR